MTGPLPAPPKPRPDSKPRPSGKPAGPKGPPRSQAELDERKVAIGEELVSAAKLGNLLTRLELLIRATEDGCRAAFPPDSLAPDFLIEAGDVGVSTRDLRREIAEASL